MTTSKKLLAELDGLARRSAKAEGVDVAWCELKGGPGSRVFRVFIERDDGSVDLGDCERVSKRLGLLLDVEDPIDSAYTLEVSTPGLDRPLRDTHDYERFAGRLAVVKTRRALVDGRKRFLGRLAGIRDGSVLLDEDGHTVTIPFTDIESGRLEVELGPTTGAARRRKRA